MQLNIVFICSWMEVNDGENGINLSLDMNSFGTMIHIVGLFVQISEGFANCIAEARKAVDAFQDDRG